MNGFEKLKSNLKNKLPLKETKDLNGYMHYKSFGRFSYILKTANNWSGPIGTFELNIIKPSPNTLLSLCWVDLKKVSDTKFISIKKNYKPDTDLNLIFVYDR
jgi:hypothetical protein